MGYPIVVDTFDVVGRRLDTLDVTTANLTKMIEGTNLKLSEHRLAGPVRSLGHKEVAGGYVIITLLVSVEPPIVGGSPEAMEDWLLRAVRDIKSYGFDFREVCRYYNGGIQLLLCVRGDEDSAETLWRLDGGPEIEDGPHSEEERYG